MAGIEGVGSGVNPNINYDVSVIRNAPINVKDFYFGSVRFAATGDGTTNDYSAINLACTLAAASWTNGGGEVYIPPGDYLLGTALSIPSYVKVRGAGRHATRLKKNGSRNLIQFYGSATGVANHCTYASLSDCELYGGSVGGTLLDCVYANNINCRDLFLNANNGHGVYMTELWDSNFDNIVQDATNSTTGVCWYIASSRAASGFGLSTDTTNVIRINNSRCENWKGAAMYAETGTGGTGAPNHIFVNNFKAESFALRASAINLNGANHVHMKNIYVYMGGFDAGYSTPVTAINFSPGIQGSLRDCDIGNSAATVSEGVIVNTSTVVDLENIRGVYTSAPTTGNHVSLQGGAGAFYRVNNIVSSNATTNLSVGANVRFSNSPAFLKAGAITDADFPQTPPNGTWGYDTTNNKLMVRNGGVWKSSAAFT
jgi:hypothetical protein